MDFKDKEDTRNLLHLQKDLDLAEAKYISK